MVSEWNGIYATHIRGEGPTLIEATAEAIRVGEISGASVQISHQKAAGRQNWGKVSRTLDMVSSARDRGVDVDSDQYPYTAGSTGLSAMLPGWAADGGRGRMRERLTDEQTRKRITADMADMRRSLSGEDEDVVWDTVSISLCQSNPEYEGMTLGDLKRSLAEDPTELSCRLLLENDMDVGVIMFSMCEEDVRRVMPAPFVKIGSDSEARAPEGILSMGKPHPRAYGTFPRVLGRYVRDLGILTWQEAIRKMSGASADKLGLKDRGYLREGYYADLVVFDPVTICDTSTYREPHRYPVGIRNVIVNGALVVEDDRITGELPGRVLRRKGG
jgi:N-acyl-D-amino-acid deacylase